MLGEQMERAKKGQKALLEAAILWDLEAIVQDGELARDLRTARELIGRVLARVHGPLQLRRDAEQIIGGPLAIASEVSIDDLPALQAVAASVAQPALRPVRTAAQAQDGPAVTVPVVSLSSEASTSCAEAIPPLESARER